MYKNASQDLEVYKIRTFMCNKKEQKHCLKKKNVYSLKLTFGHSERRILWVFELKLLVGITTWY